MSPLETSSILEFLARSRGLPDATQNVLLMICEFPHVFISHRPRSGQANWRLIIAERLQGGIALITPHRTTTDPDEINATLVWLCRAGFPSVQVELQFSTTAQDLVAIDPEIARAARLSYLREEIDRALDRRDRARFEQLAGEFSALLKAPYPIGTPAQSVPA